MKQFKLIRIAYIPDGTFGVLFDDRTPFCLTLERPWVDNRKSESCIPLGFYRCEKVKSPKFWITFEVKAVPQRSAILFHKGNLMDDSHGCIIVGEEYGVLEGQNAILASGRAFTEFMDRLKDQDHFYLEITQA